MYPNKKFSCRKKIQFYISINRDTLDAIIGVSVWITMISSAFFLWTAWPFALILKFCWLGMLFLIHLIFLPFYIKKRDLEEWKFIFFLFTYIALYTIIWPDFWNKFAGLTMIVLFWSKTKEIRTWRKHLLILHRAFPFYRNSIHIITIPLVLAVCSIILVSHAGGIPFLEAYSRIAIFLLELIKAGWNENEWEIQRWLFIISR